MCVRVHVEGFICPHVWVCVHVCEDVCSGFCVPMSGCGRAYVSEPRFAKLSSCLASKLQGPPVSASPQPWDCRLLREYWKFNSGSHDFMAHLEPSPQFSLSFLL